MYAHGMFPSNKEVIQCTVCGPTVTAHTKWKFQRHCKQVHHNENSEDLIKQTTSRQLSKSDLENIDPQVREHFA